MYAEAATGLGVLIVFGLIARFQQGRITKLDEKVDLRVPKLDCKEDMARGEKSFDEIKREMKEMKDLQITQGKVLIRIDTTLTLWAKQNGG